MEAPMEVKSLDTDYTAEAARAWGRIRPEVEDSPLEITMRIRRASIHLDHVIGSVIAASPLANYGDYEVLAALRRAGVPLAPKELAERLLVTKAAMTGRLERLGTAGLVDRSPNSSDARSADISLTTRGVAVVDELYLQLIAAQEDMLGQLGRSEREQLADLLRRFMLSLDDGARGDSTSGRVVAGKSG